MSSRALRNLLLVLAALAALYALLTLSGRAGPREAAGPVAEALAHLADVEVTRIDIRGPDGENIALRRSNGGWTVNGFEVDSVALARMLAAPGAATTGDRVSGNPANHGRLGVDSDSTWLLTLSTDTGVETRMLLGKPGPAFNSVYVRLPEQADVYLVTGDLREAAARPLDEWRDKIIARLDTAIVRALYLERDGRAYSVTRADSVWTLAADSVTLAADTSATGARGSPADAGAVRDALGELSELRATGFFESEPPDTADASAPEMMRLIVLGAASDTLLELGATARESAYELRAAGDPVLYELASWRLDRLIPALDRLAPEENGDRLADDGP